MEFYAVQRALDGISTPQLDGTPVDRYRLTGTPFSFQIATERPGRSGLDAKLEGHLEEDAHLFEDCDSFNF